MADPVCTVDEDCVECVWQKDAEKDGCNMTCCETTALSIAACEHNYQSFMDTCNRGPCDIALCAAPPKPACLNGQCVHVN